MPRRRRGRSEPQFTGDDVIIVPAVTNEEAKSKYPAGWRELKPYLRYVPDPKT